jgi:type II secretory pathway pseudopilin PulG
MTRRISPIRDKHRRRPLSARRCRGAMLLLVMFIIAVMGILLAVAGSVWHTRMQRDKEAELLWIGEQFSSALAGYYAAPSVQAHEYPRKLEQLLLDSRQPTVVRHLRRLYRDPFTGSVEWGLVKDGSGGITGVYSLGKGAPLKQGGFTKKTAKFGEARTYGDWIFVADPGNAASSPAPASGGAGSGQPVPSSPMASPQ